MKEYTSLDKLYRDWYTNQELFMFLENKGYPHNAHTLLRWEKLGVVPQPKMVIFRGQRWRVYEKDESDFLAILKKLEALPKRVSNK